MTTTSTTSKRTSKPKKPREPKTRKRSDIVVDGVFDIETVGWDKFLMGALRLSSGECFVFDYTQEEAFIEKILSFKGTLWAHNGGRYDAMYLAKHLAKKNIAADIFMSGQRITCMKIGAQEVWSLEKEAEESVLLYRKEGDLEIRDSAALIPMPLSQGAQIGGEYKDETGFLCKCGIPKIPFVSCGGYCSFSFDLSEIEMERLEKYLRQDCDATIRMLEELRHYAELHDLDLKGTIGLSAWSCARRWLDLPDAKWSKEEYDFAKEAYFGGRVQVFRPKSMQGFKFDVNSAYPAALAGALSNSTGDLPVGKRRRVSSIFARQAWDRGAEGLYAAEVDVPKMHIPPLPVRLPATDTQGERIGYPVGRIKGIWTRLELAYAISIGVELVAVTEAIIWADSRKELAGFAKRIWDLRAEVIAKHGKKHGLAQFLKLYANSICGKFAQNPEVESVYLNPKHDKVKFCTMSFECGGVFCALGCCKHGCSGKCGKWRCLDVDEDKRIWASSKYKIGDCAHVEWAAYLTAAARIELHHQLCDDGASGFWAVYCDTDSCVSERGRSRGIGPELGQWADEGRYLDFEAVGPKTYRFYDVTKEQWKAKAKGVPDAEKSWSSIMAGEAVLIDRGVETFKTAARNGDLFKKKNMRRLIGRSVLEFGDRIFTGEVTVPLEMTS